MPLGGRDTAQRQLRAGLVAIRTDRLLHRRTAPAGLPPRRRGTHPEGRARREVHVEPSAVERTARLVGHQQSVAASRLLASHEGLRRRSRHSGYRQGCPAEKLRLDVQRRPHQRASAHPQPRGLALALRRDGHEIAADESRDCLQDRRVRVRCRRSRQPQLHPSARSHLLRDAQSAPAPLCLYGQQGVPAHRHECGAEVGTRPPSTRRGAYQRGIHFGARHRHSPRDVRHNGLHLVARLLPYRHGRGRMGRPHRASHLQCRSGSRHGQLRRRAVLLVGQPSHLHGHVGQQRLQARLDVDGLPPDARDGVLRRKHAPHDAQLRFASLDARYGERCHRSRHVCAQRG